MKTFKLRHSVKFAMVVWQKRSKRKATSGRYQRSSKKRKASLGRSAALSKIGEHRVRKISVMGGNNKLRLLRTQELNVLNPRTKKVKKIKIIKVAHNPSSRHYARMNVITKGAIVEIAGGYAQVTNRPGQDGVLNGVKVDYTSSK